MKRVHIFLVSVLALATVVAHAATPVPSTVGSNLTAYNGNSGAINNAMWNTYMNPRANSAISAGANPPTADFGNCNALILRCAQPKCANGGCNTLEIARPIVSGCVQSNEACKQYDPDLTEFIAAQLVSDANAAAQSAAAEAQMLAAQSAAQQSNQQIAAMQQQMQQMQQQMQQQSADTAAQIKAALEQQQAATQQAIADVTSANTAALNNVTAQMQQSVPQSASTNTASTTNTAVASQNSDINLTTAQQVAAASGVSADLLAREQIAGQILTKIEDAEESLTKAKGAMTTAFDYAGCDSTGNNCIGPKRVSTFKKKAMEFFDPYNDVLLDLYDALILAQSVGVDITDIYMMLSGTCNVWGQYLCAEGQVMHYTALNCVNGKSVPNRYSEGGTVFGGADCKPGQVVPMSDGGCQLIKMLTDKDEIERNWLYPEQGTDGFQVRVGCASEVLDNSPLFSSMRRQADIDIQTLQRIIEQDAPSVYGNYGFSSGSSTKPNPDGIKFCAVGDESFAALQSAVSLRELPDTVCVDDDELRNILNDEGRMAAVIAADGEDGGSVWQICAGLNGYEMERCLCENSSTWTRRVWEPDENSKIRNAGECKCLSDTYSMWNSDKATCENKDSNSMEEVERKNASYDKTELDERMCENYKEQGATWDTTNKRCNCDNVEERYINSCKIATGQEIQETEAEKNQKYYDLIGDFLHGTNKLGI